ncbi:hypothetical protein [Pectobacterium colocasium]|uniref:hypothetical protein n=1 Tax=Pectobacterium colocasium TaxID=2878098 RepID=UPI003B27FDEE
MQYIEINELGQLDFTFETMTIPQVVTTLKFPELIMEEIRELFIQRGYPANDYIITSVIKDIQHGLKQELSNLLQSGVSE